MRGLCRYYATTSGKKQGHAYADGLHAVWEYLYDALDSLRSNLDLLMEQSRPAAPQPH